MKKALILGITGQDGSYLADFLLKKDYEVYGSYRRTSHRQLERLEQLYTLGNVNFDSVIIIDFGNNLKSVLTSLVYTDVNQENVLITTVNQWFDESIFYENTIKNCINFISRKDF